MGRMDEIAAVMSADKLYERGLLLRDSENILERMPTDAVKYFKEAAKKGHVAAKYELGCMYENGVGCEASLETAKEYYNSAAAYGHAAAKIALELLEIGKEISFLSQPEVPQDYDIVQQQTRLRERYAELSALKRQTKENK